MLESVGTLFRSLGLQVVVGEYLFHFANVSDNFSNPTKSGGIHHRCELIITEISTKYLRSTIILPFVEDLEQLIPAVANDTILFTNIFTAEHMLFCLKSMQFTARVKKQLGTNSTLHFNNHNNVRLVRTCCALNNTSSVVTSNGSNNLFLAVCEDDSLYGICVQKKTNRMILSSVFQLGYHSKSSMGKISQVLSHGILPIVFIAFTSGVVQMYSFDKLYKQLSSDPASTVNVQEESNFGEEDPGNQDDGDGAHDETNQDNASVSNQTNDRDETSTVTNEPSKPQLLRKFRDKLINTALAGKNKPIFQLTPVGQLQTPEKTDLQAVSHYQHLRGAEREQSNNLYAGSVTMSLQQNAFFLAVIFQGKILCLYDLSALFTTALHTLTPQSLLSLRIHASYSLNDLPEYQDQQQKQQQEQYPNIYAVEYALNYCAFHSQLPVLFLLITRRRLVQKTNSCYPLKKNTNSSNNNAFLYLPLPPLLQSISLVASVEKLRLHSLELYSSEIIGKVMDGQLSGMTSVQSSLECAVTVITSSAALPSANCVITPASGVFVLPFRYLASQPAGQSSFPSYLSNQNLSFASTLFILLSVSETAMHRHALRLLRENLQSRVNFPMEVYYLGLQAIDKQMRLTFHPTKLEKLLQLINSTSSNTVVKTSKTNKSSSNTNNSNNNSSTSENGSLTYAKSSFLRAEVNNNNNSNGEQRSVLASLSALVFVQDEEVSAIRQCNFQQGLDGRRWEIPVLPRLLVVTSNFNNTASNHYQTLQSDTPQRLFIYEIVYFNQNTTNSANTTNSNNNTSQNSNNTNNGNNQVVSKYCKSFLDKLTPTKAKQLIRQSYVWLRLDQSDYSLSAPDSEETIWRFSPKEVRYIQATQLTAQTSLLLMHGLILVYGDLCSHARGVDGTPQPTLCLIPNHDYHNQPRQTASTSSNSNNNSSNSNSSNSSSNNTNNINNQLAIDENEFVFLAFRDLGIWRDRYLLALTQTGDRLRVLQILPSTTTTTTTTSSNTSNNKEDPEKVTYNYKNASIHNVSGNLNLNEYVKPLIEVNLRCEENQKAERVYLLDEGLSKYAVIHARDSAQQRESLQLFDCFESLHTLQARSQDCTPVRSLQLHHEEVLLEFLLQPRLLQRNKTQLTAWHDPASNNSTASSTASSTSSSSADLLSQFMHWPLQRERQLAAVRSNERVFVLDVLAMEIISEVRHSVRRVRTSTLPSSSTSSSTSSSDGHRGLNSATKLNLFVRERLRARNSSGNNRVQSRTQTRVQTGLQAGVQTGVQSDAQRGIEECVSSIHWLAESVLLYCNDSAASALHSIKYLTYPSDTTHNSDDTTRSNHHFVQRETLRSALGAPPRSTPLLRTPGTCETLLHLPVNGNPGNSLRGSAMQISLVLPDRLLAQTVRSDFYLNFNSKATSSASKPSPSTAEEENSITIFSGVGPAGVGSAGRWSNLLISRSFLSQRPFNPCEALLAGLLQQLPTATSTSSNSTSTARQLELLLVTLSLYAQDYAHVSAGSSSGGNIVSLPVACQTRPFLRRLLQGSASRGSSMTASEFLAALLLNVGHTGGELNGGELNSAASPPNAGLFQKRDFSPVQWVSGKLKASLLHRVAESCVNTAEMHAVDITAVMSEYMLGARPALLEVVQRRTDEHFVGRQMPLTSSALSQKISAFLQYFMHSCKRVHPRSKAESDLLRRIILPNLSDLVKLADIAGDERQMKKLIGQILRLIERSADSSTQKLYREYVELLNGYLQSSTARDKLSATIQLSNITQKLRSRSLRSEFYPLYDNYHVNFPASSTSTSTTSPVEVAVEVGQQRVLVNLTQFAQFRRAQMINSQTGNLGPCSLPPAGAGGDTIGVLAWDLLEDYFFLNQKLETTFANLQYSNNASSNSQNNNASHLYTLEYSNRYYNTAVNNAFSSAESNGGPAAAALPVFFPGVALPKHYVLDLLGGPAHGSSAGGGREMDRVTLYARFSDLCVNPKYLACQPRTEPAHYYCQNQYHLTSQRPVSLCTFLDLSRYEALSVTSAGTNIVFAGLELFHDPVAGRLPPHPLSLTPQLRSALQNIELNSVERMLNFQATESVSENSTFASLLRGSGGFFSVEHSQSEVNCGENHESTKLLADVIFNFNPLESTPTSAAGQTQLQPLPDQQIFSGLRVFIPRGGQLDTGLFHADARRLQQTLEFTLMLHMTTSTLTSTSTSTSSRKCVVLAQRTLYSPDTCQTNPHVEVELEDGQILSAPVEENAFVIWRLFLDESGLLCFALNTAESASAGAGGLTTFKSTFNLYEHLFENFQMNREEVEGEGSAGPVGGDGRREASHFYHFALAIDGSASGCTARKTTTASTPQGDDWLVESAGGVGVTLAVDGEVVLQQQTGRRPRTYLESQLRRTMLYLLPNIHLANALLSPSNYRRLVAVRLTEVRLWATQRSLQELRSWSDQILPLASKRQRLQMQLKGAKRLFHPSHKFHNIRAQLLYFFFLKHYLSEEISLVFPTTVPDNDNFNNTSASATTAASNNLLLKKPLLAAQPQATPALSASGGQPASDAGAGSAGQMTARQKRLSMLKTGNVTASAVGEVSFAAFEEDKNTATSTSTSSASASTSAAATESAATSSITPAQPMTARERRLSMLKAGANANNAPK